MDQTRGKGPFAERSRPDPPEQRRPRWAAPPVEPTRPRLRALLHFIAVRHDAGLLTFFQQLARTAPTLRLVRNLTVLLRLLLQHEVVDVLQDGLSELESSALSQLERWGISLELLGTAHALLNVRERQEFAARCGHWFIAGGLDDFLKLKEKEDDENENST